MLASVDAATLSKLHRGQDAIVTVPDLPDATYSGKITNLGQEFDPTTRLIQVRIEVAHPDSRLRPEMLANAEFTTGTGTATLLVPQEAIQQVNQELGALTVIITHNAVMADMADRVIHFSDGRVQQIQVNERKAPASSLRW